MWLPGRVAATWAVLPQELTTDPLLLQESADGHPNSQRQGWGQAPASMGQKNPSPCSCRRGAQAAALSELEKCSKASAASVGSAGALPHPCLTVSCQ